MAREHPHNFVREAARRERQAWAYLSLTGAMILIITIAFLGGPGDGPAVAVLNWLCSGPLLRQAMPWLIRSPRRRGRAASAGW